MNQRNACIIEIQTSSLRDLRDLRGSILLAHFRVFPFPPQFSLANFFNCAILRPAPVSA